MKIGILTLPLHINYGGILQAYALQRVLESMGHQILIIGPDKSRQILPEDGVKYRACRFFKENILGHKPESGSHEQLLADHLAISRHVRPFIEKHLHCTRDSHLHRIKRHRLDAIVVGSDQIWRPLYFRIEDAFLLFARKWNIRRIAYAPSLGADTWEFSEAQTRTCTELLKRFNAVSVRESSAVDLLKEHLNYPDAEHVLDPTMLLQQTDYEALINDELPDTITPGGLFCYILDGSPDKQALSSTIAERTGLAPFRVNNPLAEDPNSSPEARVQPPLEHWLKGFKHAGMVCTDSFHACVFSLLFDRPFAVFGNPTRGMGRIRSLLAQFGQEHRLVLSPDDITPALFTPPGTIAQNRLAEWRKRSFAFLEKSLKP